MRTRIARATAVAAVALAVLLSGCGSDDPTADDPTFGAVDDGDGSGLPPDYPEECAEPFPIWFGEADLDSVDLRPGDWPEPLGDALLCRVSSTMGDQQQIADFATASAPAEVLDAFEAALGGLDGYDLERYEPEGLGHELISGTAGDVGFQVDPTPGGYSVTFATSDM